MRMVRIQKDVWVDAEKIESLRVVTGTEMPDWVAVSVVINGEQYAVDQRLLESLCDVLRVDHALMVRA